MSETAKKFAGGVSFRLGSETVDKFTELAWDRRKTKTDLLREWINAAWDEKEQEKGQHVQVQNSN